MIFGQSAGAVDICALMTSPLAAGLMHRVLMSSGACVSQPLAQREASGITLAASLGCNSGDVADCLRGLPAADIVNEQPNTSLLLVGDGGTDNQLFDVRDSSRLNLSDPHPEDVEQLRGWLRGAEERNAVLTEGLDASDVLLDEEVRARLKELGYLR